MIGRNKKRIDLLTMSNPERTRLIQEVKEELRQKVAEAKLWHSLLEAGSLTVNGNIIYEENDPLIGFMFRDALKL